MWFVYVLRSLKNRLLYVGSTNDLKRRFWEHNQGLNKSTKPLKPWELVAYIAVLDEQTARSLEKYLKKGSGKTFLKKRILGGCNQSVEK